MKNKLSIKCNNVDEFNYIQDHFLNNGYSWYVTRKEKVNLKSSYILYVYINKDKKIIEYSIFNNYSEDYERIDFKTFIREQKLNKINGR